MEKCHIGICWWLTLVLGFLYQPQNNSNARNILCDATWVLRKIQSKWCINYILGKTTKRCLYITNKRKYTKYKQSVIAQIHHHYILYVMNLYVSYSINFHKSLTINFVFLIQFWYFCNCVHTFMCISFINELIILQCCKMLL